jgi:hypothetical protein
MIYSDALIYVRSFIMISSVIKKLIGGDTHTDTHKQQGDLISLLLFFETKESRLET